MEELINNFRIYCKNNPTYVQHHFDHEDLVNDYMFEQSIYGEDIFTNLVKESKKINKF